MVISIARHQTWQTCHQTHSEKKILFVYSSLMGKSRKHERLSLERFQGFTETQAASPYRGTFTLQQAANRKTCIKIQSRLLCFHRFLLTFSLPSSSWHSDIIIRQEHFKPTTFFRMHGNEPTCCVVQMCLIA